jgi:hypothetical protein
MMFKMESFPIAFKSACVGLMMLVLAKRLTKQNANDCEEYQLTDEQERKISGNDNPIQARMCRCAHIFRQPTHNTRQKISEDGCNGRRYDTGGENVGYRGRCGPLGEKGYVSGGRNL